MLSIVMNFLPHSTLYSKGTVNSEVLVSACLTYTSIFDFQKERYSVFMFCS